MENLSTAVAVDTVRKGGKYWLKLHFGEYCFTHNDFDFSGMCFR